MAEIKWSDQGLYRVQSLTYLPSRPSLLRRKRYLYLVNNASRLARLSTHPCARKESEASFSNTRNGILERSSRRARSKDAIDDQPYDLNPGLRLKTLRLFLPRPPPDMSTGFIVHDLVVGQV
jgi:hypothetical protein